MLKLGAWVISPLVLLPLFAQEVLPENTPVSPPVDTITPVPPPEIPFGAPDIGADTLIPKDLNITWSGPMELIKGVGIRVSGPDLKVKGDNGLEIFADRAFVDFKAGSATLEGNVSVYQGNALQRGERVIYYYNKKFLDASGLRASLDPILLESGKFTMEDRGGKNVYVGENAGITTDDAQNPNFWVRAKKTTIFPNEKIVFNDLKLYAGDTPVFWLPYLSQPLNAELGYHFVPGSRSTWGVFLQNTYGIMLGGDYNEMTGEHENQWLLSRWHLDMMSRRGVGTGVDFVDTRVENKEEISGLSFYYLNDLDPQLNRTGIPRGVVNEDRYKLEFKHRVEFDFPDDAKWRADANLTLLSDEHFLEDFEPRNYRTDPAPDNTLGIYRTDETSLLSLYTRFHINDFYRGDTRLPEIAYDRTRAPLFDLPILHEGSTSFGIIGEEAADPLRSAVLEPLLGLTAGDPATIPLLKQLKGFDRQLAQKILALPLGDPRREAIRTQLLDSSYARFNTYQELSMPFTLAGFFNITPEAGFGYTHYSAVDGPVGDLNKTLFHFGAETSVKFSKDLGDFKDSRWGLDGLKHIFQPYSHWSVVSTDDFSFEDPQVDRLTPTTRPRPLDPTRFTALDEFQSWNVIRFGGRNRLLTQRDQQSFEWLYLDTYIDAFVNDPEGKRDFSNLYNDVRWEPLPWMGVEVETQFPIVSGGSGFNEFASRVRFMPTQSFEFSVGYRYLSGHPVLLDSDRFDVQTYTRLNENWGIGTRHTLELDDNTLELQQYTIHRDLGNWVAGIGLTNRDNRVKEEYGVIFSLTLKDFPDVSLPLQLDTD